MKYSDQTIKSRESTRLHKSAIDKDMSENWIQCTRQTAKFGVQVLFFLQKWCHRLWWSRVNRLIEANIHGKLYAFENVTKKHGATIRRFIVFLPWDLSSGQNLEHQWTNNELNQNEACSLRKKLCKSTPDIISLCKYHVSVISVIYSTW